jgi:hypothetical protein
LHDLTGERHRRRRDDRIGQPRADVLLGSHGRGLHPIETQPRHDLCEERTRMFCVAPITRGPTQERILYDVLRFVE